MVLSNFPKKSSAIAAQCKIFWPQQTLDRQHSWHRFMAVRKYFRTTNLMPNIFVAAILVEPQMMSFCSASLNGFQSLWNIQVCWRSVSLNILKTVIWTQLYLCMKCKLTTNTQARPIALLFQHCLVIQLWLANFVCSGCDQPCVSVQVFSCKKPLKIQRL